LGIIVCPPADVEPWPTLGPHVCDFIEDYLCHGPGDLLGQRVHLTPEHRAWIYRMYEVEPQYLVERKGRSASRTSNPRAGRRRFTRCALSLRKGSSKTEFAAWIAAAELHPDGPVRCDGFDAIGAPVPRPVTDPYIPMISYSEEQTEELAYGALRRLLQESPISGHFDIGLTRIVRLDGHGKAEAVSASPNARDGARTTFQHADETHRFVLENLKNAWKVMLANLAKRPGAEPWALETTTAFEPGARSVAENTSDYATSLLNGKEPSASKLFFFHRQASEFDIEKKIELKKAVIEASGPYISKWADIDRIVAAFDEPDADRAYLERVWLNRPTQSSGIAFNTERWAELSTDFIPPAGDAITLGFDGKRYDDSAAVIATHVNTGFQWPLRIWERDPAIPDWEVPITELNGVIADAFSRWHVCRLYADPQEWESHVATWAGLHDGDKRHVFEWWTNRRKPMAYAIRSFTGAVTGGELTHNGDKTFATHIGNARKVDTTLTDEENKPLTLIQKERVGAPIDGAMAAILSWEARNDAIAAGENIVEPEPEYEMFFL
jgi:phage terminase large subunit-like protein